VADPYLCTTGGEDMIYKCLKCGYEYDPEEISEYSRIIVCPNCGYKCAVKVRPEIVKYVKAV